MADVTITYEGNTIADLSATGTKTLLTAGKYCDDNITIDYVSPGGGGGSLPQCVGFLWGMSNGSSYQTIGNSNNVTPPSGYVVWEDFYDSNYFTYANGVFTFKQAGTYDIYYGGRGGCNTSGTIRYLYYKIFHNTTTIALNESNILTNSGGGGKVTITADVNDTLYAQIRTNSGALTMDFFLGIVKTS